ncbi:MAG: GTPase [Planctomycetales bacterium]
MSRSASFLPTLDSAALLTPRGRGAVATIRLQGAAALLDAPGGALFAAANGQPLSQQPIGRIVFGNWGEAPAEAVVVCRRDEGTVEIHCHGGEAAAARILRDLESVGCPACSWMDQETHRLGQLTTECLEALSRSRTQRTADILLDQYLGALSGAIDAIRAAADSEAPGELAQTIALMDELLAWGEFGLHLTEPWNVVLTGLPNAGKSSLLNALLGYDRAIVLDQPGTTRDVVTAEIALQGWPVRLADTAGIREPVDEIESAGIDRARTQLSQADCAIIVLDTSRPPAPGDWELLRVWPEALVVAHKADLPDVWGAAVPTRAVRVSSLTASGLAELEAAILARLAPRVPEPGKGVTVTLRQLQWLQAAREAAEQCDLRRLQDALQQL